MLSPRLVLFGILLAAPAVLHADDAWRPLFNGRNLDGWTTFLAKPDVKWGWDLPNLRKDASGNFAEPIGFNNDPLGVFKVEIMEGQPVIHVSGQGFGVLTTVQPFTNYHLRLQVKWGERKWGSKANAPRDSGLLYRCVGLAGVDHETWPSCLEFQIQEHDFGDLFALGSTQVTVNATLLPPDSLQPGPNGKHTLPLRIYDPKGTPTLFIQKAPIGNRCIKLEDREVPHGEWNQLDLIVLGRDSIHVVNGRVVMRLRDAKIRLGDDIEALDEGQIALQAEGAECYFRDIEIRPITSTPREFAE